MTSFNQIPLIQYYQAICERIDSVSTRERVLISLSLMALLFLVWQFFIQSHYDKRAAELKSTLSAADSDYQASQEQLINLATAFSKDPSKIKQAEIDKLNLALIEVEKKLLGISQSLVAAENLPIILQNVFHQTQGLELISIKTLPAEEMQLTQIHKLNKTTTLEHNQVQLPVDEKAQSLSAGSVQSEAKPQGSGVYKHRVILRLSGDYFRVLALMKALENLSWKFYWDSLDYKVIDYPRAEIELNVFTLSSEEGLLGV